MYSTLNSTGTHCAVSRATVATSGRDLTSNFGYISRGFQGRGKMFISMDQRIIIWVTSLSHNFARATGSN